MRFKLQRTFLHDLNCRIINIFRLNLVGGGRFNRVIEGNYSVFGINYILSCKARTLRFIKILPDSNSTLEAL